MTGYIVYYDQADHVSPGSLPKTYDDLIRRNLQHVKVDGSRTSCVITGLNDSSDYVVSVLPRNKYGWGTQWSSPVVVSTTPGPRVPRATGAPHVHPFDAMCSAVDVKLPEFGNGCRSVVEFVVQMYVESTNSWTTVSHSSVSRARAAAHIEAINPERAFLVRIVARNSMGSSAPSEGTEIRPGPSGGCVSELDWETGVDEHELGDAQPSLVVPQTAQISTSEKLQDQTLDDGHFVHVYQGFLSPWASVIILSCTLSGIMYGAHVFLLRPTFYHKVGNQRLENNSLSEDEGDYEPTKIDRAFAHTVGARLKARFDAAVQELPTAARRLFAVLSCDIVSRKESRRFPSSNESATSSSITNTVQLKGPSAGPSLCLDTLLTDVASDDGPHELRMIGDDDEAALLARVAGLLGDAAFSLSCSTEFTSAYSETSEAGHCCTTCADIASNSNVHVEVI